MWRYNIPAVIIASSLIVLLTGVSYGQDAVCSFEVNPTEIEFFDIWGNTVEINVIATAPSCRFTAESKYPWITFSVKQEGTGGKVLVKVEGNDSLTHRVGELTVAGYKVNIIQHGPRRGGNGS